jgi:hypothetical protein
MTGRRQEAAAAPPRRILTAGRHAAGARDAGIGGPPRAFTLDPERWKGRISCGD